MKQVVVFALIVLLAFAGLAEPVKREQVERGAWFREARFGMFIHWGIYSIPAKGEWSYANDRYAPGEYEANAKRFNPVNYNPREWAKLAKAAGMKLGLYYSQDLDWHERGGGGFTEGKTWCDGAAYWTNNWDFKDVTKKDFDEYFETKAKPQVEEILTQYGDLCLIWFDIGKTLSKGQSNGLYDLVRKLQPGCLINSRIGCGVCDYTSAGDNEIPKDKGGSMLYESPATTNDSWGYKPHDQNWKSAERIRRDREHLASIGANYLLNVGPDGLGRIPTPAVDAILSAAKEQGS